MKQMGRLKRRAQIEKMHLLGWNYTTILGKLREQGFDVVLGTVKNDVVAIRKKWKRYLTEKEDGSAGAEYLQSALELRRRALLKDDLKLAYQITKDVANMLGVVITDHHEVAMFGDVDVEVVWKHEGKNDGTRHSGT